MFGRNHTTASLVAALGLVALIGGCRGEATTGSSYVPSAEFASALRSLAGDVQTGPVALPLPQSLTVRVVDAGGRAVQGASVNWTVLGGGGTVNPSTGVSNADGLVTTTWTLGTSLGANSVRAYLRTSYLLDSATFSATATVGAPTTVVVDSAAILPTTAMVASTVSNVRFVVRDQFGYKVPSATVSFAVTAGGGSVSPATATTDANGVVSAAFTMGTLVGANTMRATVADLTPAAVTVTSTVDTSRRLTRISGDGQADVPVGTPHQAFVVQVGDRFGNLTVGDTVSWTILAGGGSLSPTRVLAGADSRAATVWTAGPVPSAGRVRAYLTRGTLRDSMDFVSTIVAGQATSFRVDSATVPAASLRVTTQTTGIRFVVRDGLGLPVPGATVTFGSTGAASAVSPASAVSNADGVVSTTWTLGTQVGAQTLTATRGTLPPVVLTVTATPDTSRRLIIVGELVSVRSKALGSALAGDPVTDSMRVEVKDQYGNSIAREAVSFVAHGGDGTTVSPASVATDASGRAAARMTLGNGLGVANATAQIAPGTPTLHAVSFSAESRMDFRDIYAGNYFACAIGTNDRAYCWGVGDDGQLGNAGLVSTNAPRWPVTTADPLSGPYPIFRELTGGESHTCGLTIARSIFCWGFNPDNRQFGVASGRRATATEASVGAASALTSTRVVEAGESYSCAVTLGGVAYCAGNNERGQIGNGSTSEQVTTTKVETGGPLTDPQFWSRVTTGERHACAMPRFNPADPIITRTPWCWGANDEGQLGNGAAGVDSTRAGRIALPLGVDAFDSLSVVAGRSHTCALTLGGDAYCWGGNGFGQLGADSATGGGKRFASPVPVKMPGESFKRLYAGEDHTCALTVAGKAYCWGRNVAGQLGNGLQVDSPVPVAVSTGHRFRNLALGERFGCGITGDDGPTVPGALGQKGMIYCWGDNSRGQLGLGALGSAPFIAAPGTQVSWQR